MTPGQLDPTRTIPITALFVAEKFLGLREVPGAVHNPAIVAMLRVVNQAVHDDETPWCSAFVNFVMTICGQRRSDSLAARSWLWVGCEVPLQHAIAGWDVVVLKRAGDTHGPEVRYPIAGSQLWYTYPPGHVGFFAGWEGENDTKIDLTRSTRRVNILGGNQSDAVGYQLFDQSQVLGVRRVYPVRFDSSLNKVVAV